MSEPVGDDGYSIYRIDPVTQERLDRLAQNLTVMEAMAFLSFGAGTDVETLKQYLVVRQSDGKSFVANEFMARKNPTEATELVIQAWLDGAKTGGQMLVRRHWPTLALALDTLYTEVHGA